MRIGLAIGHSYRTNIKERLWEVKVCQGAHDTLLPLLLHSGWDVVAIAPYQYKALNNNDALRYKVSTFNNAYVDLAIELHINAGGGNYSTAIYWDSPVTFSHSEHSKGKKCAEEICKEFRVLPWRTIGAKPQSYFDRTLYFLNNCHAPAVIVEPSFKDLPKQRAFMETPTGQALYATSVYQALEVYRRGQGAVA